MIVCLLKNALIYPKSVPKTAKMSTLKNDLSVLIPGLPARMRPTPLRIHRVTSGPAANSAPTLQASWAKPVGRSRAWTTLTTSTTTSTSTQSTFSHRHFPGWECLGCQNQPWPQVVLVLIAKDKLEDMDKILTCFFHRPLDFMFFTRHLWSNKPADLKYQDPEWIILQDPIFTDTFGLIVSQMVHIVKADSFVMLL